MNLNWKKVGQRWKNQKISTCGKFAEFEIFKRRNAKRLDLIQTAGKDVITDLLDVLDDCDRGTETASSQLKVMMQ